MTSLDLSAIRGREQTATPAPWFVDPKGGRNEIWSGDDESANGVITSFGGPNPVDAEFIAHARLDVAALLDALEHAEGVKNINAKLWAESEARVDALTRVVDAQSRALDNLAGQECLGSPACLPDDLCTGCTARAAQDQAAALAVLDGETQE